MLYITQHQRFSSSSETNEAEQVVETVAEAALDAWSPALDTASQSPAKPPRPGIAPKLTRIEVLHDIYYKTYSCCGNVLHQIGEDVSEQVEFIPA